MTSTAAFTATITFLEPVNGFAVGDITVGNGTAASFTGSNGDTVFMALITPTADGAVTVDVAADVATDAAGNGNTAAAQASSTYTAPLVDNTCAAGEVDHAPDARVVTDQRQQPDLAGDVRRGRGRRQRKAERGYDGFPVKVIAARRRRRRPITPARRWTWRRTPHRRSTT